MTLEQMQTEVKEEMEDNFPVVDFPDKEQTHYSYPCYLNVFQAECVAENLDQHTANTWKAAQESAGKRYITLMNQAIGNTELPEEVWKKIAKVNQIVLDNHSEPKTDFMVEMKVEEFDEVCKRMEADGITKTVNHILECGLLEEVPQKMSENYELRENHNLTIKAIREFITNMK